METALQRSSTLFVKVLRLKILVAISALVMAIITSAEAMSSDTVRVRSLRTINKCSGEQRALISVDLGRILTADSLLSFDISIGFDPRVLRPETLLKTGTLGEQMTFGDGPFMVIESPGIARIQGGSILRPASGAVPLTAVSAALIAPECSVTSPLTLPFGIDFNSEFKKIYSTAILDSVQVVTRARSVQNGIAEITTEKDSVEGRDGSIVVTLNYVLDSLATDNVWINVELSNDTAFRIESIRANSGMTVNEQTIISSGAKVHGTTQSRQGSLEATMRSLTDSATTTTISAYVMVDSCQCIVPAKNAAKVIYTSKPRPIVSVPDTDENAGMIVVSNSQVDIQRFHEWPTTVTMFSLDGQVVFTTTSSGGQIRVPLDNLSVGLYALHVRDHAGFINQLILKK